MQLPEVPEAVQLAESGAPLSESAIEESDLSSVAVHTIVKVVDVVPEDGVAVRETICGGLSTVTDTVFVTLSLRPLESTTVRVTE